MNARMAIAQDQGAIVALPAGRAQTRILREMVARPQLRILDEEGVAEIFVKEDPGDVLEIQRLLDIRPLDERRMI